MTPEIGSIEDNFRVLDEDAQLHIRKMNLSPLILVKQDGSCAYGNSPREKDELVAEFEEGDKLLFAWAGQWRTDVFSLTRDDLAKNYE